jgi:hypothetical protein
MQGDLGWRQLQHVWDKPAAFPSAWDAATESGWSGRTDHHNALTFESLALRHLELEHTEQAEWCWGHCLSAWRRCAGSPYWRDLLDALADSADPSVIAAANRQVLEPPADTLDRTLREALAVDGGPSDAIDADRARDAMVLIRQLADRDPDSPDSPLQHGAATMRARLDQTRREILTGFERAIDALALTETSRPRLLQPFERLNERFRVLGIDDDAAISVVDATVSLIWKVRKLDRDDEDVLLSGMLDETRPFGDALVRSLEQGRSMGRQSLAADYLVFRGEQLESTDDREAVFERALDVCPGHRNASMMLSYVRLRRAHEIIAGLSLVPGPLGKLPRAGERLKASVRIAHSYVEDAARVFPGNEELPEYRSDVRELADRLGVDL